MGEANSIIHVVPARQPNSVHEIVERLLPAYTVDGGTIQLAGCTLEDELFVQCDFRVQEKTVSILLDGDGREVEYSLATSLGCDELTELEQPPRCYAEKPQRFTARIEESVGQAEKLASNRAPRGVKVEHVATRVLWCKYAEGKLRFSVEGNVVDLAFADWSRLLQPPPFICPHTAMPTFHLATTDSGQLAAAEQIGVCEKTARRVLVDELGICSVTGKSVVDELLATCAVSGDRLLREELVTCRTCGQLVSPNATVGSRCVACGNTKSMDKNDPRLTRVLAKYPRLTAWKNWHVSESPETCVLVGYRRFRSLLIVVRKEPLEVQHVATGTRFLGKWRAIEPPQYEDVMNV